MVTKKSKSSRKKVIKPQQRITFRCHKHTSPSAETWHDIHRRYKKRPHVTQEQIDMEHDLEREHMD